MSQTMTIDIKVYGKIDMREFLLALENYGWTFNDNGQINYLPLGDEDFDWERVSLSKKQDVLSIIVKKIAAKEMIGIVMTWQDSMIGGNFLYMPERFTLSFSASINRQKLKNDPYDRFTSIDWYYSKILRGLSDCRIDIQGVQIDDF